MYDWKGRYIEQDDIEYELRRHCVKCGAFLPVKPQDVERSIPSNWKTTYDSEGNIASMTILEVEVEHSEEWKCTRCGYAHGHEEMWI